MSKYPRVFYTPSVLECVSRRLSDSDYSLEKIDKIANSRASRRYRAKVARSKAKQRKRKGKVLWS